MSRGLSLQRRKASRKAGAGAARRQKGEETRVAERAVARRAGYLRAKMALSQPQDAAEVEADRVADAVSQTPVSRSAQEGTEVASAKPSEEPVAAARSIAHRSEEDQAQTLKRRGVEEDEADVKTALRAEERDPAVQQTASRQEEEEAVQAYRQEEEESLQAFRQQEEEEELQTQRETGEEDAGNVDAAAEAEIERLLGTGDPLPEETLADMNDKFGADFSDVRIHTGAEAAQLASRLQARAFTVGSDVFFADGEFAPNTQRGRKLLAHELTHVVQGGPGRRQARRLYRAVSPEPSTSTAAGATALATMSTLELPPIKHRHAALYTGAGARRAAGYSRNTSRRQTSVWRSGINITDEAVAEKLRAIYPDFVVPESSRGQVTFKVGNEELSSRWSTLKRRLRIPTWDRRGARLTSREDRFQVDHMVELQVFGDTTGNAGNVMGNLELLKGSPNASSGSTIKNNIYSNVREFLAAEHADWGDLDGKGRRDALQQWLDTHTITFTNIERGSGQGGDDSDWWTRDEIEAAAPLEAAEPAPADRLRGRSGVFVLASGPGGIEIARYRYSSTPIRPRGNRLRNAMAGVSITEIELNESAEQPSEGQAIGTLRGTWNLPRGFRAGEAVEIPLLGVDEYCGSPGAIPDLNTSFEHLSPVSLPGLEIVDGRLYAEGEIRPSIPLLRDNPIQVVFTGDDLRFEIEYSPGQLHLPVPGLSITDSSVSLFYSVRDGFGGAGQIGFAINQLGDGSLEISVDQRNGFSVAGQFNFDSELFDRATIEVWYREQAFGGAGEIGIDSADKIRGIRSANLRIAFGEDNFSAEGDVQPDIPGIEQAGLEVSYSEEDGLVIGGNLALSADVPGIESGSIDVTLQKQEEAWRVAATGSAVPSIPGVDSELSINYDDGAFTAEVNAEYSRGMLSGRIDVGVTNRGVGDDGELSESAEPGNPLIVFGGGQLTIQIAPWLQGTAGVNFAPNGEITVTGEIGLPNQLEIFPRQEINRSIFNIAVQAPIVPGIVAEIGGGLGAVAGIGPGVIDELRLGIEYNPAHEENTRVTGDAHLSVPADAGLRLSVRAGIGLGITGASATGGLEVGGTLGIEGAAEAGVHLDWTPTTGLDIQARVGVWAQPAFTFDISGYVSVRALGFSVYDETWQLASFTFGSDYRFGISLPVHYREGEPFDISLDDVEFEVPDIDTSQLLRGLVDRVT